MSLEVEFQVLGPLRVLIGREIGLHSRRQQVLLATLLVNPGRSVSPDGLIDALWGEQPPASAASTLRTHLSRLRSLLGLSEIIVHTESGYSLQLPGESVDSVRFERLTDEGRRAMRSGDPVVASRLLREGLGLWRGPAFGGLAALETIRVEAARLEEIRLAAMEERIDADLMLGRHTDLIGDLERLTSEHPFRERIWGQLMVALYRSGRQADALQTYQRGRELLGEELGIEPSAELQALEEKILLQDPGLRPPPVPRQVFPIGAITFLFTEIEEASRLWEEHPEEMEKATVRYHQILGDAFERYGGHVFSTTGDGHSVVFHRLQEALAAAVDAQQSLQSEDQGEPPIRVRMAIHTGEADEQDGGYQGSSVNRCARLLAACHGEQILVSGAARELIGDNLPPQIELLDKGEQFLKDSDRPERIYQLIHPDLEQHFPPVRSRRASHNLPVQLTSFVGRAQELAEVDKLVHGARLVTLTGTGGSGKTRLALQAAAGLLDRFSDGVQLVELATLEQPGLITQQIAGVFGLKERGASSLADLLYTYLHSRQLLLVVDNCEHLIDEAAEVVSQLLTNAPQIQILTTSREPLRVPGEVIYQVPRMTIPDSTAEREGLFGYDGVRLFVERAEHAQPGFRVTNSNAEAVLTIVSRLDGIPLAIELAAAQLTSHGVDTVASRLDHQLKLLTVPARGVPDRHQTLAATVEWSYQLLTDAEKSMLGCLSVFRGNIDLPAVESLCASDGSDVVDTLSRLVDKSLVLHDPSADSSRFHLLETIREFADQTLTESDRADLQRSHAFHYAARVADAEDGRWEDEATYLERTASDDENLLAALSRSLASDNFELAGQLLYGLRWYWWSTSIPSAARQWVDKAATGVDQMNPITAALTYLAGGTVYLPVDLDKAGQYLKSAVDLLEILVADDEIVARHYLSALYSYGAQLWLAGETQASVVNVERTLDIARRFGYLDLVGLGLINLTEGVVDDDPERAVTLAQEALQILSETGPPSRVAEALVSLGHAEWHAGDQIAGEEHLKIGIVHAKDHGHEWGAMDGREVLAGFLIEVDRIEESLDLLEENATSALGTINFVWTLADLAFAASRINAHETATALSSLARLECRRSGHSPPSLSERLNSVESEAQTKLSVEELRQAVARGELLNPTDLTEVISELRSQLAKGRHPTQPLTG